MKHSQVALPDTEYLARIGEIAYTVAYMEWIVLGDLQFYSDALPDELALSDLEPKPTGRIARALEKQAGKVPDESVRTFVKLASEVLDCAAKIRNVVLHARPATNRSKEQELYRSEYEDRILRTRFFVTGEWLDEKLGELHIQLSKLVDARLPLPS